MHSPTARTSYYATSYEEYIQTHAETIRDLMRQGLSQQEAVEQLRMWDDLEQQEMFDKQMRDFFEEEEGMASSGPDDGYSDDGGIDGDTLRRQLEVAAASGGGGELRAVCGRQGCLRSADCRR